MGKRPPADGAVRKAKPTCRAVTPAAAHSSPPSSSRSSGGGPYSRTLRRRASTSNSPASAGGLFPIEHYVVANSVTGLEPGVYHYAVLDEALELLRGGDHRLTVAHAALDQAIAAAADAVFVWTAVLERSRWKYGQRFARYAFFDDEAAALLGVDEDEEPVVYMTTVGRPAGG